MVTTAPSLSNHVLPALVRRTLTEHVPSAAPWADSDEAIRSLREATPPMAGLSPQTWRAGIAETLSLIHASSELGLSPARHFLFFRSRQHRNQPYQWYVVHISTGTHLIKLGAHRLDDGAAPADAALDLSHDVVLDYIDAIERLPGRHGSAVNWGATSADLFGDIGKWQHPHAHPGQHVLHIHPHRARSMRALHRAAVLHALAADPARDAITATVQNAVTGLLTDGLALVYDRDPAETADHFRRFLLQLNGGRRRDRHDTRTPEERRGDASTTAVVTLAALAAIDGNPHQAVTSLRAHATHLQQEHTWYTPADRIAQLNHSAALLAELFSPAPTERQLLRRTCVGDVLVLLHPDSEYFDHSVDRVLQVTGPVQYLELGTTHADEHFALPVNDLTTRRAKPALLLAHPGEPYKLLMLDERAWNLTLTMPDMAVDRWAILGADAAGLDHEALALRARAASRRAADAFDAQSAP